MIIGTDHYWADWSRQNPDGSYSYSPINFAKAYANGSRFTFLKACSGWSDTRFYPEAIRDARAAGILSAPYCWLYENNATRQADFWYSRLKNEPVIWIDFESYLTSIPKAHDLYEATERLRTLGYKGIISIYTGHDYWTAYGNSDTYWIQFPVCLARYNGMVTPPELTPPWGLYDFWQYSASGDPEKYGITSGKLAVDEQRFDGTPDELAELFGAAIPPEPPIGETMITIATVISPTLNVRSTPDLDSTTNIIGPGFLKAGDLLHCVEETTTCIRLTKAQRGATALILPGPVCWVSIGAAYVRQIWHIANDAALPVNVNVTANGAQVHNKDVPAGGAVAIDITD
jgi:hypothetical protein